jgi:hypothetical protein
MRRITRTAAPIAPAATTDEQRADQFWLRRHHVQHRAIDRRFDDGAGDRRVDDPEGDRHADPSLTREARDARQIDSSRERTLDRRAHVRRRHDRAA